MNIVQLLAHSIEEYDMLRLHAANGHRVFSPGAYIDPRAPMDDKRPLLDIDPIPELRAIVDALGQSFHAKHGTCDGADAHHDTLDACKRDFPDELIEWADVLIVHHLEHTWLVPQWQRVKHKRVIWRTVGQSADRNEAMMAPLRREGLQIVRYSPKERNIPGYAGEDALIRFYKDPDEWHGWTGDAAVVTNITQHLRHRSLADDGALQPPGKQWTSFSFWEGATRGLPRLPAGPGSEAHGGTGALSTDQMKALLRRARCYLYTGTQPASYTLGLIEAMMTGIPVVSIGPKWMQILPSGPQMFEGHEIAPLWTDNPVEARLYLERMIREPEYAAEIGAESRRRALYLFAMDRVVAQWQAFLGGQAVREVQYAQAVA